MAKNTPTTAPALRTPRGAVKVNGESLAGWIEFDTTENEFAQADEFSVLLAMSGLPEGRGAAWWATQKKAEIELYAGFPQDPESYSDADLDLIFSGRVDDIGFNWTNRTVSLTGRDLTSLLIDRKTSERNVNLTASAIATRIAGAAGLTPKVEATSTKVGKYYQIDRVDIKEERTDWDLLTWLAREEGYMVFVRGKELHFRKKPDAGQDPYVVQYVAATREALASGSVSDIRCGRSLMAAKGVKVIVRSWNLKQKKAFERTASRGGGDLQEYRYNIANLTPDQADARADQLLEEISRHAMTLEISGPADNLLRIDNVIRLQGTGTACDQVYYPRSIRRSLTFGGGYSWEVSAKNKADEGDAT